MIATPTESPLRNPVLLRCKGFPPWLDCSSCLSDDGSATTKSTLPSLKYRNEEKKRDNLSSKRLTYEEEQEAREKAKVERAKMAWKKASRAAMENSLDKEKSSSPNFRKAADALIRSAERQNAKQVLVSPSGSRQISKSPTRSQFSGASPRGIVFDAVTESDRKLRAGTIASDSWKPPPTALASPSLSDWTDPSVEAALPVGHERSISPLASPRYATRKSANLNALLSGSRSDNSKLLSSQNVSMASLPSPTTTKSSVGRLPSFQKLSESLVLDVEANEEEPVLEKSLTWSAPSSRNSVDSPRLSQSQALLAKLGGLQSPRSSVAPGFSESSQSESPEVSIPRKEQSYPWKSRGMSPHQSPIKSPTSKRVDGSASWENRRDSKNFSVLKEEAYDILMVQNQKRMQRDRHRRSSTETGELGVAGLS